MGKRAGKDIEATPGAQGGWSFHDWCAGAGRRVLA